MIEWLLSRAVIVGLAIVGGILSLLASWIRSKGGQSVQTAEWLGKVSYVFMGISIALFVVAGVVGPGDRQT